MAGDDMITAGEFTRFRDDLSAWQGRLMVQLQSGFDSTHERLDAINGRVRHTEECQAVIEVKVERLENIETHVLQIQKEGCAAFESHRMVMAQLTPEELVESRRPKWPARRQVLVGGGLVGAGVAAVPVIEAIGKVLHSIFLLFVGSPK